jgi:hypothetical protein
VSIDAIPDTTTADIIDDPEETLEPELVLTAEERQLILD